MTFTISKTKFAIAILAVAMLVPATAMATHVFDDVPDDKFYAGPVEWAFDNGITTGKTPTTFDPDGAVTRGESVTFLKRYNDNIVEPALEDLEDADTVDGFHANELTRVAYDSDNTSLDDVVTTNDHELAVSAPVDGVVIVTATIVLGKDNNSETGSGVQRFRHGFLLDGTATTDDEFYHPVDFDNSIDTTITDTLVIPVSAGDHTITGRTTGPNGTFATFIYSRRILAQFVPFGNDGLTASAVAPSVDADPALGNENS